MELLDVDDCWKVELLDVDDCLRLEEGFSPPS